MEMRSVSFFLVTFAVLFSVVVALPTFTFSGSTQLDQPNVGVYGGIYLEELPCSIDDDVGYFDYNYVAWNIFIDASNASYYFVRAHATNQTANDDPEFSLYIYTSFDPTNPCQGLYGNGQFVEGYVEGIKILDGVNLVAGSYIIVATTDDGEEAVFGIEFSPATTIVPIQPGLGLPFYSEDAGPAYYDSSSFSNNCSYDEEDDQYIYNNFSWTASTSGYFDIYAIIINSTHINASTYEYYEVYLSLYSGSIASVDIFQANPCQSNFINGYERGEIVTALDYIWLNAGSDYTLVVSIQEIYGSVAIQVVPSNFFFLNNASFFAPDYYSSPDDCTIDDGDGDDDDDDLTSWVSLSVTAWYPVFVVADVQPINTDYWGYFDNSFYLYDGNLNGNPPIACTGLIQIDSYSLGGQFTIGSNYTIILIDDEFNYPSLPYLNSASHLFVLTGPYINTASFAVLPSSTGSLATSSSSSSTSSTSSTFSSSSSVSTATSASSVTTVSSSSTASVSGSTGIVSGTSTSAKPTTGTTGIKATTGVAGSSTATGSNGNASDASHTFVSMFAFSLLIFALSF